MSNPEFVEAFYLGERIALWRNDLHPSVLEKYEEILNSYFIVQMMGYSAPGFVTYKCTMKTPNPEGKDGVLYGPSIRDIANYIVTKFIEDPEYVEVQYERPRPCWYISEEEPYTYSAPKKWWRWVGGKKAMYYTMSQGA